MAQRDNLRKRIVEHLRRSNDGTSSLKDIVQNLGTDKKCINQVLYALKRANAISQVSHVPPVWKLKDYELAMRASVWQQNSKLKYRPTSPKRKITSRNKTVDQRHVQPILEYLKSKRMPVKTIDIAKELGFKSSSEINPVLYRMERNGIVRRCEGEKVMWTLNSDEGSQQAALLNDPGIVGYGTRIKSEPQQSMGGFSVQEVDFVQPMSFHSGNIKCESNDVSDDDPFMGNVSCSQLSEVGYESSQSEPSLGFDQINDARRTLRNQGYTSVDDGSDWPSTENEMDVNTGTMSPICQSTPILSSPNDDSATQYEDGTCAASTNSCDMEDTSTQKIDNVLKGLSLCSQNSVVSFIIAKKAQMEKSETEECLRKCQERNFVSATKSGSDVVYSLTEAGENYIKSKVTKIRPKREQTVPQICAPPRVMNKEFRGPPPAPASLVQNPDSQFYNHHSSRLPSYQTSERETEGMSDESMDPSAPKPLMSLRTVPSIVNTQSLRGYSSNPSSYSGTTPFQNVGNSNSYFQPRVPSFGRGFSSVGNLKNFSTISSPGFNTRPPAPVDIISKQLNETDISSTTNPELISTSHVSKGLQKLLSLSATTTNPQQFNQSTSSSYDSAINHLNSGPRSLGMPARTCVYSEAMDRQPKSLPLMRSTNPFLPSSLDLNSESFAALNKNPVSALMEYAQSRHQEAEIRVISQSGPSHKPKFVMGVFIGGKQIAEVTCSNKKDGRKEAADKALRALIASGDYKGSNSATASKPQVPLDKMTHFDKVAALVHRSFNELSASISENFSGRKVIAGLVMKMAEHDIGTVISIGTGNRCITGPQLSLEGNTVNDSHAEIITRRGFIRFIYKQLQAYKPGAPHRLFEPSPSGKLRLKDNITFHLYISTAPCGDGALFSPRDEASNNAALNTIDDRTHNPTFTSAAQGLVRTKMEGGEGTIPVEEDFTVQTFDGIQRGERLRTMSCTDKLCRWNVVGMQGALLSHLMDPVYLDSLTLGLLYDHGHLARAMCCRLARGDPDINSLLSNPFHLNHPWLGRVTVCDVPRETQKTKAFSVNWCFGDAEPEVTDGTLGLCCTSIEKTLFSRCSKRNLYDNFKQVCADLGKQDLLNFPTYGKAKMAAEDFQTAKKALIKKFKDNGYGTWVSKPPEEEMFS